MEYQYLDSEKVRHFSEAVFCYHGLSEEHSKTVVDVLLTADLLGIESHGIQRLIRYHKALSAGQIQPDVNIITVKETPISATLDANQCMGHISSTYAMNLAIKKAKETGIGMVAVRNSTHFGIAGYYTRMALQHNLAGFATTNTEQIGVPTFGKQPMIGTNPLAFSMPAEPYPFWFDSATTVVTHGKIEICQKAGKQLEHEWAVDENGAESLDPAHVRSNIRNRRNGGILPLGGIGTAHGGHKGYGFAMVAEICSSIWAGGPTCPHMADGKGKECTSHFFAAIDPGLFGDKDSMIRELSIYMQEIRDSEKADGHDRIYTHGELDWISFEEKKKNGIPVQLPTVEEMKAISSVTGIAFDI